MGTVLASNSALVSAIVSTPGLGPAIARQPHLAAAVVAEDGWLAGSIAASPVLASAIATDSNLALAVSLTTSATGGDGEVTAQGILRAGANSGFQALSEGGRLAERLARDPGLLPSLGPNLTRIMADNSQVRR